MFDEDEIIREVTDEQRRPIKSDGEADRREPERPRDGRHGYGGLWSPRRSRRSKRQASKHKEQRATFEQWPRRSCPVSS